MGLLSIGYNKRSAEQYSQNWGALLKTAIMSVGSFNRAVSSSLNGLLFIFVVRN